MGVAFEDDVVDLAALVEGGLIDGPFDCAALNAFLNEGPAFWGATRANLQQLIREGRVPANAMVKRAEATMHMPFEVADYVDFYSSIDHATNVGKIFRPGGEPLSPNYRWMPIGYHGRSSTISVANRVVRPWGQVREPSDPVPRFTPSQELDYELELGFLVGAGNAGRAVAPDDAGKYLFGAVLLCDWSARDLQSWEAQPLGPFLSKSFATTISPWVVTMAALEPYRVAARAQEPQPLPYLRSHEPWAFDIQLSLSLQTPAMRKSWDEPEVVTRVNFLTMYWSVAQQLAHLTSNGGIIRPGDLLGSGTISGTQAGTYGSLLEATLRCARPIILPHGEAHTFLEDGDTVVIRGVCARRGLPQVGFGEMRATIEAAPSRD